MKFYNNTQVLENNTKPNSHQYYYIKISEFKKDALFLIISLSIILILSFLLYRDIYKSSEGIGKPIGTIVFKKRTALRKLKNQSIWEFLQNELPVYNGDSIKTEEFSEAVLKLNDGTEIALNENTYVVLNFTSEETKINFNYGSIEARTELNKQVKIETKDTKIELSSGNAKLIQNQESFQIQLDKGKASIQKDNLKEQINENEVALLNKNNQILKEKAKIVYLSPEDNTRFITNQTKYQVTFNFELLESKEPYELLISLNPTFRPVLIKIPLKNAFVKLDLNPGTYYWKIIQKGSDVSFYPIRKFSILTQQKLELLQPSNNQTLSYKDNLNILFSWKKLDVASSYELWIDSDRNFKNPLKIQTLTNMISVPLDTSKHDIYYWKVIPNTSIKDLALESDVYTFKIEKIQKLKEAKLLFPKNETIYKKSLKSGLNFSWQYELPNQQTLQIATDENFNNIIFNIEGITTNFYHLKQELSEGTYYWRIINQDKVASKFERFIITDKMDFKIISPLENSFFFYEKNHQIEFRWNLQLKDVYYKIFLSDRNDFKNNLLEQIITLNYYKINTNQLALAKEGIYFWKIEVYNKSDNKKLPFDEKVSSFYLYHYPQKTIVMKPQNNQKINLLKEDKITFLWNKTKYTDYYEYEIYKNGELITKNKTNQNYFILNQIPLLGIGIYDVKIYSIRNIHQSVFKSEPETVRFLLEYTIDKKPEFLTPEKIIIE